MGKEFSHLRVQKNLLESISFQSTNTRDKITLTRLQITSIQENKSTHEKITRET
jgi:hypothetical protein